jgi:thiamine biosynthesis lipoprotein
MTPLGPEHERRLALFGTDVRVLVSGPENSAVEAEVALTRVQAQLENVHRTLTRFEPDSELSLLNAHAGEWVPISETMMQALRAALFAAELSDGLIDPTLLRGLERAGYTRSLVGRRPVALAEALSRAPARRPAAPRAAAEWQRIQLDHARSAVRLPRGVRLDLGGSAKGMAVDAVVPLLERFGAFAVDAGGDIQLGGTSGRPRTVAIDHPLRQGPAHEFTLATGAVATSGLRSRLWATGRDLAHHLIDPSRLAPAWTGVIQATALAPSALEAETLAKVALLRGPLGGRVVLQRHGGALILDSGELVLVDGVRAASTPLTAQRRSA